MRFPQVSERVKEAPANALRSVFASIGQVLLITDRMKKKPGESEEAPSGAQDPATAAATTETAPAATVPAPTPPADATAEAPAAGAPAGTAAAETAATEAPAKKPAARKPAARKAAATAPAAEPAAKPAAAGSRTRTPATERPAAKRSTATGNVRLLPDDGAKATPPAAGKSTAAAAPAATAAAPEAAAAPAAAAPEVVAAPEGPVTAGEAPLANYDQLTIASLRARLRNLSIEQVRALIGYERAHENRPEVIAMFERRVAKLEAPES